MTTQALDLLLEGALFEGLLKGEFEFLDLEGFAEEIGRSAPHGFDDVSRLSVTRKHHDRHVGQTLFELVEGLEAVHSGQDHIEGDQIGLGGIEISQSLLAIDRGENLVSLAGNQRLHVVPYAGIVVDHQNPESVSHSNAPSACALSWRDPPGPCSPSRIDSCPERRIAPTVRKPGGFDAGPKPRG